MKKKIVSAIAMVMVTAMVLFGGLAHAEWEEDKVPPAGEHADPGVVDDAVNDPSSGDKEQVPVEMNKDGLVKEEALERQEPEIEKPEQWEIEMMEEQKREKMEELEMEKQRKTEE